MKPSSSKFLPLTTAAIYKKSETKCFPDPSCHASQDFFSKVNLSTWEFHMNRQEYMSAALRKACKSKSLSKVWKKVTWLWSTKAYPFQKRESTTTSFRQQWFRRPLLLVLRWLQLPLRLRLRGRRPLRLFLGCLDLNLLHQ